MASSSVTRPRLVLDMEVLEDPPYQITPGICEALRDSFLSGNLEKDWGSNLTLVLTKSNEKMRLQKITFRVASPAFAALLNEAETRLLSGYDPLVEIGIDKESMEVIRHFVYTAELLEMDLEKTLKILECCVEFQVKIMLRPLVDQIKEMVASSPSSAFQVYHAMKNLGAEDVVKFIRITITTFLNTMLEFNFADFATLSAVDFVAVFSCEGSRTETTVLAAAILWAEKQLETSPNTGKENLKFFFSQVSPAVRFGFISNDDIVALTVGKDILDPEQLAALQTAQEEAGPIIGELDVSDVASESFLEYDSDGTALEEAEPAELLSAGGGQKRAADDNFNASTPSCSKSPSVQEGRKRSSMKYVNGSEIGAICDLDGKGGYGSASPTDDGADPVVPENLTPLASNQTPLSVIAALPSATESTPTADEPATVRRNSLPPEPRAEPERAGSRCSIKRPADDTLNASTPSSSNSPNGQEAPQRKRRKLSKVSLLDTDDDLFSAVCKVRNKTFGTFDSLLKYLRENSNKFINVDNTVTVSKPYRTLPCDVTELVVNLNLGFIKTGSNDLGKAEPFLDFVNNLDLKQFIPGNNTEDLRIENFCENYVKIDLQFNGVTFLKMNQNVNEVASLVLNYVPISKEIMDKITFRPSLLAVSNCEFSMDNLKSFGRTLTDLILYRAWGDYNLTSIGKAFPKLEKLIVWKCVPECLKNTACPFSRPLALDFTKIPQSLLKVGLFDGKVVFPHGDPTPTNVKELILDHCYTETGKSTVASYFSRMFPKLERLVIKEDKLNLADVSKSGNLATSDLFNAARRISTIREIKVENLKWGNERGKVDGALRAFLRRFWPGGVQVSEDLHLVKDEEGWRVASANNTSGDQDKEEYEDWELSHFYSSPENYEEYCVVQSSLYPKMKFGY